MKRNILLVDPDGDVGTAVLEAAARTNRSVQFARTVRDAFGLITRDKTDIDAVVVDLDQDGHGMCMIEALSLSDNLPVIALTGFEEAHMKPVTSRHGAADCLGKPLTPEALARAITRVCGSNESSPACSCDRWGHPCSCEQEKSGPKLAGAAK